MAALSFRSHRKQSESTPGSTFTARAELHRFTAEWICARPATGRQPRIPKFAKPLEGDLTVDATGITWMPYKYARQLGFTSISRTWNQVDCVALFSDDIGVTDFEARVRDTNTIYKFRTSGLRQFRRSLFAQKVDVVDSAISHRTDPLLVTQRFDRIPTQAPNQREHDSQR